jgi:SAM-dependent methyltransferase
MTDTSGVPREFFDHVYEGAPPWEIGRPQGDVIRLADRGGFKGKVLDVGCGSGENSIYLASKDLEVLGIDRVPAAIELARKKAAERKSTATFEVADVLKLTRRKRSFDTVLDSGLFHTFSDDDRARYAKVLAGIVKNRGTLHILCFSNEEPGTEGPRRVGERELIELFNMKGWLVEEVAEARFETTLHPDGARAWLATFTRMGGT